MASAEHIDPVGRALGRHEVKKFLEFHHKLSPEQKKKFASTVKQKRVGEALKQGDVMAAAARRRQAKKYKSTAKTPGRSGINVPRRLGDRLSTKNPKSIPREIGDDLSGLRSVAGRILGSAGRKAKAPNLGPKRKPDEFDREKKSSRTDRARAASRRRKQREAARKSSGAYASPNLDQ